MTTGPTTTGSHARELVGTRQLVGTARLLRLALRRDRILLPVWLLSLLGLVVATVASIVELYGTEAERTQYALIAAGNVVARAFDGPMSGTSLGAIVMTEVFGFLAVLVGIMSVQTLVRHTRLEEETGRSELIGATVVGRHAPLSAALILVVATNLLLAVLMTVVLLAWGLPVAGSVLAGAATLLVGLTFAGVAAVAAQIAGTARGANAIGGAVVGMAFLLRAVGDALGTVTDSGVVLVSAWPSWGSPIGWGQQVRAFHDERVWVLLLPLAATVALLLVAVALTRHRDVGSGMLPERPGPARAGRSLRSPAGLAWRLHRGALLWWTLGLAVMAAAIGAITHEVAELLETSDELAALIGDAGDATALTEMYVAFALLLLSYAVAAELVQAVLRVRVEEVTGRAEPVLATAVGRGRLLGAHLQWAVLGAVLGLLVLGLVAGTVDRLVAGDQAVGLATWLAASLVPLPAVLVVAGTAVLAVGWVPRASVPVAWGALLLVLVIGQFGGLLQLPEVVMELSPFTHLPAVPAEDLELPPLLVLTGVATLLFLGGFLGWRRRDLHT